MRRERRSGFAHTLVTTFENVNIFFHLRTFPQEKLRVQINKLRRVDVIYLVGNARSEHVPAYTTK